MMPSVQERYEQRKQTFSLQSSGTYYRANDMVQHVIQSMLTDAVDELLHIDTDAHTQSVITRIKTLLDERHKRSVDPMPIYTYVTRGINTAASTIGNMFLIAPDVFESTYGRKPSADELKTVMANSYPLALELASLHLVGFVTTDKQIRVGRSIRNDYNPGWFTIKSGVYRLEFHPDRWDEIGAYMTTAHEGKNEPRVGCPSIFSVAPPNRSPLYHIYTYVTELHGQVYEWYFSPK